MLCSKLVFSFMCEAFLFGKRIENFCYAHAMRMRGLYVGGTGGYYMCTACYLKTVPV